MVPGCFDFVHFAISHTPLLMRPYVRKLMAAAPDVPFCHAWIQRCEHLRARAPDPIRGALCPSFHGLFLLFLLFLMQIRGGPLGERASRPR
jgi:hypothetical protein